MSLRVIWDSDYFLFLEKEDASERERELCYVPVILKNPEIYFEKSEKT